MDLFVFITSGILLFFFGAAAGFYYAARSTPAALAKMTPAQLKELAERVANLRTQSEARK